MNESDNLKDQLKKVLDEFEKEVDQDLQENYNNLILACEKELKDIENKLTKIEKILSSDISEERKEEFIILKDYSSDALKFNQKLVNKLKSFNTCTEETEQEMRQYILEQGLDEVSRLGSVYGATELFRLKSEFDKI